VTSLGSRLDAWIHGFLPVTAEGLALSRILYASFFLVVGIPTFSWVGANPPGFFHPPPLSLAAFLGGFPPAAVLRPLDVTIGVLLVFLLTGYKTRASSVALTVALVVGDSFRYSFGKIDHSILSVVMPAVMAFSGWEACWSIDARNRRAAGPVHAWPVTLLALLLGFGFLSAGLPKVAVWVDFDLSTQGARSWLVDGFYAMGRRRLLAPWFLSISNPYFWEAADLLAVAFETSFVFSLVDRRAFRTFLFLAVMFHVTNLLMLNITFVWHLPVYAVFLPWEQLTSRLPRGSTRVLDAVASYRGMAVLLGLVLPLYLLLDRVPVDTAADAFSPAGILAGMTGTVDYPWTIAVLAWAVGLAVAVVVAGFPRRRARLPDEVPVRGRPVVLFDGVCNLCNGLVDFLVRHDRAHRLRFASLQSEIGRRVAGAARPDSRAPEVQTVYLVDADGWVYERSDAIVKILVGLGGPFALIALSWLVPRLLRDAAYRVVSRSRYRIFGRRESCRIPAPGEESLFI
jgi:predicted DCC family thiol-disulfide oxidoreductase YuxK